MIGRAPDWALTVLAVAFAFACSVAPIAAILWWRER